MTSSVRIEAAAWLIEHPNAPEEITEYNPVCGDAVKVSILIKDNMVQDIRFVGRGCSISQVCG